MVLPLPPALVAVIVYVVADDVAVGVPEITPVLVLNDKPEGSEGLIDQPAAGTAPPVLVGVKLLIAVPTT